MNISINTLGRPLALTAATVAMITLAACSGPADPASTPAPTSSASVSDSPAGSTPAPGESASSAAASPSAASSSAEGNDALLAAAALAAKEISGGKVVSIEAERNGWEVNVVTANGDEQQLRTNAAGTQVTAGPTDDRPDADDRAENKQFAEIDVDVEQAVKVIEGEVDGGQINEVNLDLENRRIVWEADVSTGSEQRSVQVDATDGSVVSNRIDD